MLFYLLWVLALGKSWLSADISLDLTVSVNRAEVRYVGNRSFIPKYEMDQVMATAQSKPKHMVLKPHGPQEPDKNQVIPQYHHLAQKLRILSTFTYRKTTSQMQPTYTPK
jgi:hypothetical protein